MENRREAIIDREPQSGSSYGKPKYLIYFDLDYLDIIDSDIGHDGIN